LIHQNEQQNVQIVPTSSKTWRTNFHIWTNVILVCNYYHYAKMWHIWLHKWLCLQSYMSFAITWLHNLFELVAHVIFYFSSHNHIYAIGHVI
jgi:hypothetical protein